MVAVDSGSAEVWDLQTGRVRHKFTDIKSADLSWTSLFIARNCAPDCRLIALNLRTGRTLWKRPGADFWHGNILMEPGDQPLMADATPLVAPRAKVIMLRRGGPAVVAVVDAASGKDVATVAVPDAENLMRLSDSLVLHWAKTGTCVIKLSVLDIPKGALLWTQVADRPCATQWRPALNTEAIVLGSTVESRITILDLRTGDPRWAGEDPDRLVAVGERAVITQGNGQLRAIETATGKVLWKAALPKDADGKAREPRDGSAAAGIVTYGTQWQQNQRGETDLLWVRDAQTGAVKWFDI